MFCVCNVYVAEEENNGGGRCRLPNRGRTVGVVGVELWE